MPISPYGASKLAAEGRRPDDEPGLRPAGGGRSAVQLLWAADCPGSFCLICFASCSRNPDRLELLGSGRQVRDFTFVSDTVAGLLVLAQAGVPGEAYNVSSGQSMSVRDLAVEVIAAVRLTGRTEIVTTGTSWVGDAQRWEVMIGKLCCTRLPAVHQAG